ncbi:MAG: ABC transporter permease [Hymenobacteraceae bacterium]|nr:ABC transporter permease [Hymenobacteraceae bacterium]MDX5395213.1 ABC transporter permease [Hymenobacteraceae bacterium]MDX5511251.1 ABC transporter permease [Hymenobacteraceae bacterium]
MKLLRIELLKLIPYRIFWIIIGIFAALMFFIVYAGSKFVVNGQQVGPQLYDFPDIWAKLAYIASYFNLLLGILIIILVSDEYSFRTMRQQVIDGLSRAELVQQKFYVVLLIGFASAVFVMLLGLGFGFVFSKNTATDAVTAQLPALGYYLVQALGYLSLAMLFSFLIRKSGLAIIAYLVYTKIVEPIIHYRLSDEVDQYFPMKVLSSLTPMPGKEVVEMLTGPSQALPPSEAVLPAVIYIGMFFLLSYLLVKFRDL